MPTYQGDKNPAVITKLFGEDYEGPLSDYDEFHALELGAWVGFTVAVPQLAAAMAAVLGGRLVKDGLTGSLKRQVRREPHYAAVGAVLAYLLGVAVTNLLV